MPEYPIAEALKAQRALRSAAGLGEELFPLPAFIGMVSDEIEALRQRGTSDEEIAALIRQASSIDLTADQIAEYYATPEQRHAHER